MRMRLVLPVKEARRIREKIKSLLANIEQEDWTPNMEIVCYISIKHFIHPLSYYSMNPFVLYIHYIYPLDLFN